jgi:hypothetical protein
MPRTVGSHDIYHSPSGWLLFVVAFTHHTHYLCTLHGCDPVPHGAVCTCPHTTGLSSNSTPVWCITTFGFGFIWFALPLILLFLPLPLFMLVLLFV